MVSLKTDLNKLKFYSFSSSSYPGSNSSIPMGLCGNTWVSPASKYDTWCKRWHSREEKGHMDRQLPRFFCQAQFKLTTFLENCMPWILESGSLKWSHHLYWILFKTSQSIIVQIHPRKWVHPSNRDTLTWPSLCWQKFSDPSFEHFPSRLAT